MALTLGKDYAIARKFSWVFENGVGNGVAVVTRRNFYALPYDVFRQDGQTQITTTATIGGAHPAVVIQEFLANPDTTVNEADARLVAWCEQGEGGEIVVLDSFKRIKIYTGFIRRSIVLSLKDKGLIHGPETIRSVRPSKAELPAWVEFFNGDPRIVAKK